MNKLPHIQFYTGDWLNDAVAGCSLAAQGLWLRMMILMHDSPRYGYLLNANGSLMQPWTAAQRCGCSQDQYEALLKELDSVGVPSRQSEIIFSRRMVRDAKKRAEWRKRQNKHRVADCHDSVTPMSQPSSSSSPSSSAKPKEKSMAAKGAARAIRWPEGFCLTKDLGQYAIDHGVADPAAEWQKFENNHRGKGSRFVEWNRAWYTWVGNYHEFRRGGGNGKKGIDFAETDRALRKLANV